MADLEAAAVGSTSGDHESLTKLGADLAVIDGQIQATEIEWMELSEELETMLG